MTALVREYVAREPQESAYEVAERLGITEILTADRADFDVCRLPGNRRSIQVLAV